MVIKNSLEIVGLLDVCGCFYLGWWLSGHPGEGF
jgi:hypothetical protein